MFLLALLACDAPEPEDTGTGVPVVEDDTLDVEAVPATVEFGALALGATAQVPFQFYNHDEHSVTLSGITSTNESLTATSPSGLPIGPEGFEQVVVTWTPTAPGALNTNLELLVTSAAGGLSRVLVPVTGASDGPVVSLSTNAIDFGNVTVGCEGEQIVTVTNSGSSPLTVSDISYTDAFDFSLAYRDGELGLPWTLAAGESRDLQVRYDPMDEAALATILRVTTDDPFNPTMDINIMGDGDIEEDNSITYDVIDPQNVTMIFAINQIVISDRRLDESLPTLLETLDAAHVHYRIAFITSATGEMVGDVPYVDDSMTTDEAMDGIDEMLAHPDPDNDYLLSTLDLAIEANRDWLLDESDAWAESKLSLIGMNSDQEQSNGNYMTYLLDYWEYKDDEANIVVDAIGGDVPGGCGGLAEPFAGFDEAAAATGGQFLSICASDWISHMETIATTGLGETNHFVLTGNPAEWSIEVWVSGVRAPEGWTYDADAQEVVFDDDHLPEGGETVRIDYIMATECE